MDVIFEFRILLLLTVLLGSVLPLSAQPKVAITLDDVPNTRKYQKDSNRSLLLEKLDSINIPITIFVNEGLVNKTDDIEGNKKLLENWVSRNYTTLGNHTYSHFRYSDVGFDVFSHDIEKGELLLKSFADKYQKPIHHFRFPYNDIGKDAIQHIKIDSFLQSKGYTISPFTVESSDWMFNFVYEYYLAQADVGKAKSIGDLYVSKTLEYFHFFDSLSIEQYGRKVNQVYLCHDNTLNTDYLSEIIKKLEEHKYSFISLDKALQDPVYNNDNTYYRKWGVSWFYRWMTTQKERVAWMKKEPDMSTIESLYNQLSVKK